MKGELLTMFYLRFYHWLMSFFNSPYVHGISLENATLFSTPAAAIKAWGRYINYIFPSGHYFEVVPVNNKFAVKVCSSCGYLGLPKFKK